MSTFAKSPIEILGLTPNSRPLFLVAHPDDEVLMQGALSTCADHGLAPKVVFATNGEASTKGDQDFVRSNGRITEATASLGVLGIKPSQLHFFELADGKLGISKHQLAIKLGALIRSIESDCIFTLGPKGYDGHADHIATHVVALDMKSSLGVGVFGLTKRTCTRPFKPKADCMREMFSCHGSQFFGRLNPTDNPQLRDYDALFSTQNFTTF